jgi:hypothetical protein
MKGSTVSPQSMGFSSLTCPRFAHNSTPEMPECKGLRFALLWHLRGTIWDGVVADASLGNCDGRTSRLDTPSPEQGLWRSLLAQKT